MLFVLCVAMLSGFSNSKLGDCKDINIKKIFCYFLKLVDIQNASQIFLLFDSLLMFYNELRNIFWRFTQ